ncbi:MAG: hypothetical protein KAT34_11730 [Candidatus Aminicenantes bacterium]|nr:hypothetical protein [Candidatus Aminicenantes bacterium]
MVVKKKRLDELKINEAFLLSYPPRPELGEELKKQLFDFPLIVINKKNEIISGIDFYHYFKAQKEAGEIDVLQGDFTIKEALFLNFNLKNKFFGLNLYEKLIFVKKIGNLAGKPEIYAKTDLDINLNRELLDKLEYVSGSEFKEILIKERVTLKSALMLCDFEKEDRKCLLDLFAAVYFSTSQQLKILEMTEEILFRDKISAADMFKKLKIGEYFKAEKPQKKILDEIFKHRFPVYSKKELEWKRAINDLHLPGNVKISHYPFFEKKQVDVHIALQDPVELKKIVSRIKT